MKNNKGFTMIELLTCIIILGILMGLSVTAVYKHIEKSKQKAYENLELSIYDGARNYIMDKNMMLNKCTNGYTLIDNNINQELVENEYLSNIIDPANKNSDCEYEVYACKEKDEEGLSLSTYKYKVMLKGRKYHKTYIHDDNGEKQEVK